MNQSVPLTQAELLELLSYDPETGGLTWRERDRRWFKEERHWRQFNTLFAGKPALNAENGEGYLRGRLNGSCVRAHRVIFVMAYGILPDIIDHIDGDRRNNRLSNLRSVSAKDNCRNRIHNPKNRSGTMGVWLEGGKWRVAISENSRDVHIGRFESYADAVAARKMAEISFGYHSNHGRRS